MKKNEDVPLDLEKHSIKKLQDNLRKVMTMVKDTLNIFNCDINPNFLYHIGTGKVSSESTATFLLNIVTTDEAKRKKFINECVRDLAKFEKSTKQQKLATFETESSKQKI